MIPFQFVRGLNGKLHCGGSVRNEILFREASRCKCSSDGRTGNEIHFVKDLDENVQISWEDRRVIIALGRI